MTWQRWRAGDVPQQPGDRLRVVEPRMDLACPIAGRVALLTAQSRLLADGRKQADQVGSLFGVQQRLHETFSSLVSALHQASCTSAPG